MAKQPFLPHYILLVILVLSVFDTVKGEICWEDLGACDASCPSRCGSKHSGGKASCNASPTQTCMCCYECGPGPAPSPPSPPPPSPAPPRDKTCNVGIGTCSTSCNDACCNSKCSAKFPAQDGHGMCMNIVPPYNLCLCTFKC
ncbi:hypothetical protein FNV43_RR03191 [Rhamnella rubrinervis]|uniref:Defensin-like protein n=1 Tax=Rhamnella rubrinervis TaxID=2594499 RepID=A0A8K0HJG7_9ROSA|nr:hypothetical protein FNV43_RR03191 [Rhamnella rubrinervis]